jgi:hypothetical protein
MTAYRLRPDRDAAAIVKLLYDGSAPNLTDVPVPLRHGNIGGGKFSVQHGVVAPCCR